MKLPAGIVACLLPLMMAGCFHKTTSQVQPPLAPPIEDTLPKPSLAPANLPPPVITVPEQTPPPTTTQAQQPPKPPVHHRKPAPKPVPAAPPEQQASNENTGVSAIGQLSSGAPSDLRQQTANSIQATERELNAIAGKLNDQEQKTAAHIRGFLKQAREALSTGDVDGAHTLAAKAKVLLSELAGS
jgi:outer membrane biosynthesis protein TonB